MGGILGRRKKRDVRRPETKHGIGARDGRFAAGLLEEAVDGFEAHIKEKLSRDRGSRGTFGDEWIANKIASARVSWNMIAWEWVDTLVPRKLGAKEKVGK